MPVAAVGRCPPPLPVFVAVDWLAPPCVSSSAQSTRVHPVPMNRTVGRHQAHGQNHGLSRRGRAPVGSQTCDVNVSVFLRSVITRFCSIRASDCTHDISVWSWWRGGHDHLIIFNVGISLSLFALVDYTLWGSPYNQIL